MQDDSWHRRAVGGSGLPPRLSIRARRKLDALEPALGYHVILRLKEDRDIAPTPAERRAAACIMIHQGRERRLLACAVVASHAHAILLSSRAEAGAYAGRTATSLSLALRIGVAFESARIEPLRDSDQVSRAFERVLCRDELLSTDDFFDGTNLPDLVGLRVNGAYSRKLLREQLPRVSEAELLARFGVDWEQRAEIDPAQLIEATMAATGRSSLKGRVRENLIARRAAANVARARINAPELARLFGIDVRTAFRLRAASHDEALARAIELQLRLRALRARRA